MDLDVGDCHWCGKAFNAFDDAPVCQPCRDGVGRRLEQAEKERNRIDPNNPDHNFAGYPCDYCGAKDLISAFLHRHVCPADDWRHRSNYEMDYLARELGVTEEKKDVG